VIAVARRRTEVRWYLRIAEAGLERRTAVREYVGISESLKLDYRGVQPCGSTLAAEAGLQRRAPVRECVEASDT
jgi:hypothetical protein